MPAWVLITPLAAVAFAFWIGWGRGWLRSVRYSWAHARHVIEQTAAEYGPGTFYGSMSWDAEHDYLERAGFLPAPPVDPAPWRAQMTADLSPEALGTLDGLPVCVPGVTGDWLSAPPDDPGPGVRPSSLTVAPGPVTDAPGWPSAAAPVAEAGEVGTTAGPQGLPAAPALPPPPPSRWLAEQLEILRAWSERQQAYAEILA